MGINVNIFKDISVDNFFIARYLDTTQVAFYGLASTLVMFIARINPPSMLRGVFQPIFIGQYVKTKDTKDLMMGHFMLTKITLFCMLPLYLLLVVLANPIIRLIYSPGYLLAIPALFFLCFFFFFVGLNYTYNPLINTLEKNELFFITGIFSIYNLIMDILLIPRFGIQGAAIATGSAGFLQYVFYWCAFRWYLKLKTVFPWKAFYKTILNSIPMVLFCFFAKPYISNVFQLLGVCMIATFLYLILAYLNNIFNAREMNLFKRVIGKG
jgi:O-antigen/teichoic acid export membrane protein